MSELAAVIVASVLSWVISAVLITAWFYGIHPAIQGLCEHRIEMADIRETK